jgi:Lipase (class 3)/Wntless-like, transmembrane domain
VYKDTDLLTFGNVNYVVQYHNINFRIAEMCLHGVFTVASIVLFVYLLYRIRETTGLYESIREQKWILMLMLTLILYQNPFFIPLQLQQIRALWLLSASSEMLAVGMIMLLWLLLVSGMRFKPSAKLVDWAGFYSIPVIIFIIFEGCVQSLVFLSGTIVWGGATNNLSPKALSDSHDPVFVASFIIIVIAACVMLVWLATFARSIYLTNKHLRRMPYIATRFRQLSFRFFLIQSSMVIIYFIAFAITRVVRHSVYFGIYDESIATFTLLSVYALLLVYIYLPVNPKLYHAQSHKHGFPALRGSRKQIASSDDRTAMATDSSSVATNRSVSVITRPSKKGTGATNASNSRTRRAESSDEKFQSTNQTASARSYDDRFTLADEIIGSSDEEDDSMLARTYTNTGSHRDLFGAPSEARYTAVDTSLLIDDREHPTSQVGQVHASYGALSPNSGAPDEDAKGVTDLSRGLLPKNSEEAGFFDHAFRISNSLRYMLMPDLRDVGPDDGDSRHFSLPRAYFLSYFSYQAYYDAPSFSTTLSSFGELDVIEQFGYRVIKAFSSNVNDTHCIIAQKRHRVIVAFRGTASRANVRTDLSWRRLPLPRDMRPPDEQHKLQRDPMVHGGFLNSYTSLRDNIVQCVRDIQVEELSQRDGKRLKLFCTGHSMGGALAMLFAMDVTNRKVIASAEVYNYGSPRLGNHDFAMLYEASVPRTFRLCFDRDIITTLPKFLCMYKHAGIEVIIDRVGNFIVDPLHVEKLFRGSRTSFEDHRMRMYMMGMRSGCLQNGVCVDFKLPEDDKDKNQVLDVGDQADRQWAARQGFNAEFDDAELDPSDEPDSVTGGASLLLSSERTPASWSALHANQL